MSPASKSMVFQSYALWPHMTVRDNVKFGLDVLNTPKDVSSETLDSVLLSLGMDQLEGRYPSELSGGQQSRVALARGLLQDKPILLLDEPFTALGPALKNEMLDLLQTLAQERQATVLMVTHDPNDALRIADETLLLSDQVLSPPQPTTQVMASPPKALAAYLGLD